MAGLIPRRARASNTPAYSGPWLATVGGVMQWATSWSRTSSLRAHFGICSTPLTWSAVARRCPKPGRTSRDFDPQRATNQSLASRASTHACMRSTVGSRRPASTRPSAR
ncbi:MAG TPA: hypothetical protein VJ653_03890 [Acidimicrobiales bacterium]|nr:hypothetical protein [Acidimicrobiales bacterium]